MVQKNACKYKRARGSIRHGLRVVKKKTSKRLLHTDKLINIYKKRINETKGSMVPFYWSVILSFIITLLGNFLDTKFVIYLG